MGEFSLILLTSLTLYHNLGDLSRGFLSFFKKLFEVPNCGWRLTLSPRTTMGLPHISWVRSYLPLTLQIIAHLPTECNRQNAQNRDFYFLDICATFLLTKCWRCVIMEICAPHTRGRADENALWWIKKPTAFVSRSQKRWGNSVQMLAISGATPTSIS